MGKLKKTKGAKVARHNPLDQEISEGKYAKLSTRVKVKQQKGDSEEYVDDKLTKRILSQARQQQEDLEEEFGLTSLSTKLTNAQLFDFSEETYPEEDENEGEGEKQEDVSSISDTVKISEEEEEIFRKFMPNDPDAKSALSDMIKDKLTEKQTELQSMFSDGGSLNEEQLATLRPLYKEVGHLLSRYRSGKLPKAFKAIPKFRKWEEILHLTDPDNWTASAMYQAVKLFSSNLNEAMAQRFYNLVLLPRLRDDIAECKKLNPHLYWAVQKSLFKPAAFFRGLILPLCENGCTVQEAVVFSSVIAKHSIPRLHSSAALYMLSQMGYSTAKGIIFRTLIEKRYQLPYRAIDGVVDYFLRFKEDKKKLPLMWHQNFILFVQIYKNDISFEQRRELLELLTIHKHAQISPEIRKELMSSTGRCKVPEAPIQPEQKDLFKTPIQMEQKVSFKTPMKMEENDS